MKKGKFIQKEAVNNLSDNYMIGMRAAAGRMDRFAERYEKYFIQKDKRYYIVENPTKLQSILADFKHFFYSKERKGFYLTSFASPNCNVVSDSKAAKEAHLEYLRQEKDLLLKQKKEEDNSRSR